MTKHTYMIPKVAEDGEDVKTDADKFDGLLGKMLRRKPETNVEIVASRKQKPKE